jgi:hypothetical protein
VKDLSPHFSGVVQSDLSKDRLYVLHIAFGLVATAVLAGGAIYVTATAAGILSKAVAFPAILVAYGIFRIAGIFCDAFRTPLIEARIEKTRLDAELHPDDAILKYHLAELNAFRSHLSRHDPIEKEKYHAEALIHLSAALNTGLPRPLNPRHNPNFETLKSDSRYAYALVVFDDTRRKR